MTVGSSENGPNRHRPSRPTVKRFSLSPFRHVPEALLPVQVGSAAPHEFWNQLVALIPPRPCRVFELVVPLATMYENIGFRSRPLIGVISGAKITAQSSPRTWNGLMPMNEFGPVELVPVGLPVLVPVVCWRPVSISSMAT